MENPKSFFRKIMLAALLLAAGTVSAQAQVTLVKNGKAKSRIALAAGPQEQDVQAAELLQRFVRETSGAQLPIVTGEGHRKGDVVIGTLPDGNTADRNITEDGFSFDTRGGILTISGRGKGTIYAVVTLLEEQLGMNYWGENEYDIVPSATITLPELSVAQNPGFRHRQSQNYAMRNDPVYKMWMRLEEPREVFAGGYWVHTFDALLPSTKYGAEHPEYYSYFRGERHPGKASQWCLSNPEVFEIVSQRIDSIFKANPGKNMISVSQNDGNFTHCQCDLCSAVDEYEESLSGSVIHFMNKLATRFPDKEFSTLAYLYTMKPPRHVKPLPNVNIMLCDIDCDREVTLTENASGREFVEAMEGWSAISNNIFMWDYGINFDNYLTPFPNFHVLAPNIRLFKENNVTMHFSQIAGSRGGDFAELRTWMVSKLMWNPNADPDELMKKFLNGYYGDAAPYIYRYIKTMEGALLGSGQRLWIYDSPVSHKRGMLKPELMRRYAVLFDSAEEAVAQDSVKLARVHRTRLPLQFAEIDIARTEPGMDVPAILEKLALFEQRAIEFAVPTINERNNSPVDYVKLYRERYLPSAQRSTAFGAEIIYGIPPTGKYASLGLTALTDGLFGGSTFTESWVGWEGTDGSFTVDLGEEREINSIEADFLHQLGAWILLPTKVAYSVSADGKNFTQAGSYDIPEDSSPQVKFVQVRHDMEVPAKARYIKVEVTGLKTCPHWHYGVGNPCWFFIDEVTVL